MRSNVKLAYTHISTSDRQQKPKIKGDAQIMNEYLVDKIIHTDKFPFSDYKELVDTYSKIDSREIIFQNRVVMPFLDKLFGNEKDISIVDISTQNSRQNTDIHDTRFYKKDDASSPDLLVARHWNYANVNNDQIDYLAVIEVKSPVLNPIYKTDEMEGRIKEQVKMHLVANDKVILTDCIKWCFFKKGYDLNPIKTINLNGEDDIKEWNELCEYICEFSNGI